MRNEVEKLKETIKRNHAKRKEIVHGPDALSNENTVEFTRLGSENMNATLRLRELGVDYK